MGIVTVRCPATGGPEPPRCAARTRAEEPLAEEEPTKSPRRPEHTIDPPTGAPGRGRGPRPRNYSWAELMRRVFDVDVLECPACRGRMRILAAIHPSEATRAILKCLGLPPRATPTARQKRLPGCDLMMGPHRSL